MVGIWATFVPSLTDDYDSLLLPSPEFHDDDPSSYLLYPPGFGPVEDWPPAPPSGHNFPMLPGEAMSAPDPDGPARKGAALVFDGGWEGTVVDGSVSLKGKSELETVTDCEVTRDGSSGALELVGLSEALSGKVSLMGESDCGEKDGVEEYMVIGSLEKNVDGEPGVCDNGDKDIDVSRASGNGNIGTGDRSIVPQEPLSLKGDKDGVREASEAKVEDYDDEETNVRRGVSMESETVGSSSSSDSSSEESTEEEEADDDDSEEDERGGNKGEEMEEVVDLEEGEIRDLNADEVAMRSDDEEDGDTKVPIRSKNELEVLPPVPPVNATLEPHHRVLPVGVISSVIGSKVIVEGLEKHNPLNEGSILWITKTRSPLGLVDEIFGPVKNPYYVVRFNSGKEIPAGVSEGTAVSFVIEFANHILNELALYKKGYDASGENDEEVGDEVEFSDDEKEAEYKRSLHQAKRGTEDRRQRDQESIDRKRVQLDKKRCQTRTADLRRRKDVKPLAPTASVPISQLSKLPNQPQSMLQQPLSPIGFAPTKQPPDFQTQLQSALQQLLAPSASVPISQLPNASAQLQSALQQLFIPGQVQAQPQPTCFPGQMQAPPHQPFVPVQIQAPTQPPSVPGKMQAPPHKPSVPGNVQAPPRQPSVLHQLQGPHAPLQQPCAPSQLQAPTLAVPHYVLGPFQVPTPQPCLPGQLQAPPLTNNLGGGDFACSSAGGLASLNGPPMPGTAPTPFVGQAGGSFGVTQSNLLAAPQSNAVWANGVPTQQLITGLSSMFPNNVIPCQQLQDRHPFHQNQNQLFSSFPNEMPFQHQFIQDQGITPSVSWQNGLPNPSVVPPSLEHSHGHTQSGHISTGGGFGISKGDQNTGLFQASRGQRDMHELMKFSFGNSSPRGRKQNRRGGS